jgi:hypothetical protein
MGTGTSFIVSERTTTFLEKKKVSGSEWGPFSGRKETGGEKLNEGEKEQPHDVKKKRRVI